MRGTSEAEDWCPEGTLRAPVSIRDLAVKDDGHRLSHGLREVDECVVLLYRYNLSSFFNRGMMLRERW